MKNRVQRSFKYYASTNAKVFLNADLLKICFDENILENFSLSVTQSMTSNLCSGRSKSRGVQQKIVSFSFWGELKTGYFRGILDNLELMRTVYPGWVMRLYVSRVKTDEDAVSTLCDIQCNNNFTDM